MDSALARPLVFAPALVMTETNAREELAPLESTETDAFTQTSFAMMETSALTISATPTLVAEPLPSFALPRTIAKFHLATQLLDALTPFEAVRISTHALTTLATQEWPTMDATTQLFPATNASTSLAHPSIARLTNATTTSENVNKPTLAVMTETPALMILAMLPLENASTPERPATIITLALRISATLKLDATTFLSTPLIAMTSPLALLILATPKLDVSTQTSLATTTRLVPQILATLF